MSAPKKYPIRNAGFEFGDWVVVEYRQHPFPSRYLCLCKGCDERFLVDKVNLEKGRTRSCIPCANRRIREEQNGIYVRWSHISRDIIDRLANRYYAIVSRTRPTFRGYGWERYAGRNIENRFDSVYDFIGYVTTLDGYEFACLEIDRIDNDGHYERGNLRFVTRRENLENRSRYVRHPKRGTQ